MTTMNPLGISRSRAFWGQVRGFVFIFAALSALRSAVADWNDVPTGSMVPTILVGDRIFVNKLAYDLKLPFTTLHLATWSNPRRGDVIVLFSPADGQRLVKRVVALPGDVIELRNNQLFLNGSPAQYNAVDPRILVQLNSGERSGHTFATETEPVAGAAASAAHPHAVMGTPNLSARRSFGPIVVPPNQYFVMGDNRDNSFDSRYFGFVDRGRIVGRAVGVVASLDLDHHWVPRWGRFFESLH